MSSIQSYRGLIVWQKSFALAKACYFGTLGFPATETYGMTSQVRRAAASIPANIAEGNGRETTGFYIQALRIAQGSLKVLETHLLLAHEVSLMNKSASDDLLAKCDEVGRLLRALIRSLQEKSGAE